MIPPRRAPHSRSSTQRREHRAGNGGVSANTVRNDDQILEEIRLGFTLEPWRRSRKRRLVETAKFSLFDGGIANDLDPESRHITEGSDLFGRAFEHLLSNEVRAFLADHRTDHDLSFRRTTTGYEVDLIVGDLDRAPEFKSSSSSPARPQGVETPREEHAVKRFIIACRQERRRKTEDGIEIVPRRRLCDELRKRQRV
ncbi:MAG: DUF4143 domain-containing protein [Candidatus Eisenbacteria bacterium]|nr:DUF4143 domain-containing protein [Candidatus Latescibacterota bacterium]MBD3303496.1 DUF4143 domain-containing protein [Candidatus Eisenbacteria bacterium]